MNKFMKILMVVGLIVAVATPALAEFKLNGYFRTQGYTLERKQTIFEAWNNLEDALDPTGTLNPDAVDAVSGLFGSKDGESQQFTDQRLRLRAQYSLNDNVAVIYYAEMDNVWGEGGGSIGSDAYNVQTKQAFVNIKFDDTNINLGTQGLKDNYLGLVYDWDMTGVSATQKFGGTTIDVAYSKWDEGNRQYWDDQDFYVLGINQKFSDAFNMGATAYYWDDNDFSLFGSNGDLETWFLGADASFSFDVFNVNGFFLYQTGKFDANSGGSTDTNAWTASIKGNMKLENGELGLRYMYFSYDDDKDDFNSWRGLIGGYAMPGEGLMIFAYDPYYMNSGAEAYALQDAATKGFGLHAVILTGSFKLPDAMYFKAGAGYFAAAKDSSNYFGDNEIEVDGKTLGYEVNARFGKKFFEKVDVSLNAAYAGFGSFYDDSVIKGYVQDNGDGTETAVVTGSDDPDNIYKAYLMVNVPF